MITVSGLTKQYGGRTVVDDVSFTLEPGTVTGFLGPNGAGKTTTMRMIAGLVPAGSGSALVDGRPYAALPNPGAVIGTMLDAGAVAPRPRRARPPAAHRGTRSASPRGPGRRGARDGRPDAGRGRRIRGYSLGMRRRLGIAAALLATRRC